MKTGDTVTIKNKAGLLKIRIVKELYMRDVAMGLGDDKLPILDKPRLEYHRGPYDHHLITLCDSPDTTPFTIYLLDIEDYYDNPKCYLGICDETEQDVFETIY